MARSSIAVAAGDDGVAATALVTGASSGFGSEFARGLAARGYDLILTARRVDRLQALQTELRAAHPARNCAILPADLAAAGSVTTLLAGCADLGRPIDVLINNAGFGMYGPFLDAPIERTLEMIDLNTRALTELTWRCARSMAARKSGRILLVSSIAAYQPSPGFAAYAATKAYVSALGLALHHELKGTGVSVTVVEPGTSPTEFGQVAEHGRSLMHSMGELSADTIAESALNALFNGQASIVPGWRNATMTTLSRFAPRGLAAWFAARLTRRR